MSEKPEKTRYGYQETAHRLFDTGRNLLICAPTGAGKTDVGFEALARAESGTYLAPTRALCYEKMHWLTERFPEARVVLGNKDYNLRGRDFARADFRVITPWKLNQLVQSRADLAKLSPAFVLDELQQMSRNPDTDLVLTKLLVLHGEKVQISALSAAIHEDDIPKIAAWLNALVVESHDRPVPLLERVVNFSLDLTDEGEEITQVSIEEQGREIGNFQLGHGVQENMDAVLEIVLHIRTSVGDTAPALVFTPYQKRAEFLASSLRSFQIEQDVQRDEKLAALAAELPNEAGKQTGLLKKVLPYRIGIHHGGMTQAERELVFQLALQGKLDYIITCLTLAHGVNLPARHLICESVYDYDSSGQRRLMDISLYRNLSGRAGRPQFDEIGYVWIPTLTEIEKVEVQEVLLKYKASRIESRVFDEYFLTAQLPGLIQLGFNTASKLAGFLKRTFAGLVYQDLTPLVDQCEKIISHLIDLSVIKVVGPLLVLTPKGQKIARLGIHPGEYEAIATLIERENTDYNTWMKNLCQSCQEYVLPRQDTEQRIEIVESVINYGLAIYAAQSHHMARQLADYVGRLLEITASLMGIETPSKSYEMEWREKVLERFAYGNLKVARLLAPVLKRYELKRLVRNLGMGLAEEPEETVETPSNMLVSISAYLWGHRNGDTPANKVNAVAQALNVSEQVMWDAVQHGRTRKNLLLAGGAK